MSELYKNADKRYLVISLPNQLTSEFYPPTGIPGLLGSYDSIKQALANHFDDNTIMIYDRIAGVKIDLKHYPRPEPKTTRSHHRPRYYRGTWPHFDI